MAKVFQDPTYPIYYELMNLNRGFTYEQYADGAIKLGEISAGSRVLELGSATGMATCTLFDKVSDVMVTSIDRSEECLKFARLKFGLLENPDTIYKRIREITPYSEIFIDGCDMEGLESHLRDVADKHKQFAKNVKFYNRDASELSGIAEEPFDYVFATHFIHWPRKENATQDKPNYAYEKEVLQQVRNNLKDGGLFIFNTTGADFRFDDDKMNQVYMLNHPFYVEFKNSLNARIGLEPVSERHCTFDNSEITRIMKENGFQIITSENIKIKQDPYSMLAICYVGEHMQTFEKEKIRMSIEQREQILRETIEETLEKVPLGKEPIIDTGVHYVVKKC